MLPKPNDLHPPGRNGKALVVTPAIVIRAVAQADWISCTLLAVAGGVTAGQHAG